MAHPLSLLLRPLAAVLLALGAFGVATACGEPGWSRAAATLLASSLALALGAGSVLASPAAALRLLGSAPAMAALDALACALLLGFASCLWQDMLGPTSERLLPRLVAAGALSVSLVGALACAWRSARLCLGVEEE